ncbi:MAG: hypothetical protein U1E51_16950 [Candidatus Binatia bacterium]|nr:hypothetical protein [Candidatus Binatia bacterium]
MTNPIVELTPDQILDCRQRMRGQWHALGIAPDCIDTICDMALRAINTVTGPEEEPFVLPQKAIELLSGGGIDNLSPWDRMQAAIRAHAIYERLMEILGDAAPVAPVADEVERLRHDMAAILQTACDADEGDHTALLHEIVMIAGGHRWPVEPVAPEDKK